MSGADRLRIGVVDDDPIVRESLRDLLGRQPGLDVVFVAADGEEAIVEVNRTRPDVVLMDIRMPGIDGIATTAKIRQDQTGTRVMLMTSLDLDDDIPAAIAAGASGLILKTSPLKVLADQLRSVHHGAAVWTAEPFYRWNNRRDPVPSPAPARVEALTAPLTERELEILRLLCQAQTNHEIAESLYLAESTVKTHVSAIMTKLGVTSRLKAVIRAHELGLA